MFYRAVIVFWVIWPVLTFMGGQGVAPAVLILSIAGLGATLSTRSLPLAAMASIAFVGWVCATSLWSTQTGGLIHVDPDTGAFAIEAAVIRLALTVLCSLGALAAALKLQEHGARLITRVALVALTVQAVILALSVPLSGPDGPRYWFIWPGEIGFQPLDQLRLYLRARPDDTIQNIERSVMMFTLAGGLFAALALRWRTGLNAVLGIAGLVAMVVIADELWAHASMLALAAAAAGALGALVLGRATFWLLGIGSAIYLLATPFLLRVLTDVLGDRGLSPANQIRVNGWSYTLDRLDEKPIVGWGVEASKTWSDVHGPDSGALNGLPVVAGTSPQYAAPGLGRDRGGWSNPCGPCPGPARTPSRPQLHPVATDCDGRRRSLVRRCGLREHFFLGMERRVLGRDRLCHDWSDCRPSEGGQTCWMKRARTPLPKPG